MKKLLLAFALSALIVSCKDEKDVEPANEPTFIRYFGSEYNHTGVIALEAHNGYAILSNVLKPTNAVNVFYYRMKLTFTDLYGNKVGEEIYKTNEDEDLEDVDNELNTGYQASSLIPLSDGFLIVGHYINQSGKKELHLRKVGVDGKPIGSQNFRKLIPSNGSSVQVDLQGKAVTESGGSFYVLAGVSGNENLTTDMYVSKMNLNDTTFTEEWSREYGTTAGNLLNRIYVSQGSKIFWGGSYQNVGDLDFRLVAAPFNSLTTDVDVFEGERGADELAVDFCETLGGFAIVGSKPRDGNDDIYFAKVSYAGIPLLAEPAFLPDFSALNDRGVSVCPGQDGGYMVLGTVESGTTAGYGGDDILLAKVNDVGVQSWSVNYGSDENDEGVSVRQTSDGGYLVLGTTTFGNESKLMLLKVKPNGKF